MLLPSCNNDDENPGTLQLTRISAGNTVFIFQDTTTGIPINEAFAVKFSDPLDTSSIKSGVHLLKANENDLIDMQFAFDTDLKSFTLTPLHDMDNSTLYYLDFSSTIKGIDNKTFPGAIVYFETAAGKLTIQSIIVNNVSFNLPNHPQNIDYENITIEVIFSHPLDPADYQSSFSFTGNNPLTTSISTDNNTVTIHNTDPFSGYKQYYFHITDDLESAEGFSFDAFHNYFYTALDSTLKFPLISDEELLDLVQRQTFRYFYDFAHPVAGLARERNTSGDVVTTGGSGFGIMALIVGMERGFITRQQGLEHLGKMLNFLETCDRYHGAWPHWLNGSTGQTYPFSTKDDGADLVETGFLVQGLMTMRQYLHPGIPEEDPFIARLNSLIDGVEWDWFTRGLNVLYWHWSPNYGWDINMRIEGYNEALIVYVMAAASPTHTINPEVYHEGYARNGAIVNGGTFYGYKLPLGWDYGGPLFFTHYSHLGLDPRNLSDQYGNYWEQGVNMSLINYSYCVDNPKNWVGYRPDCWGLTASDNPWGYNAHSPTNDLGVITPTAAVSALPYTPEQSMAAIRHFYFILGDKLWGEYGFYDAFDVTEDWWATSYIAIDQGPVICMIENYRTGLLWDLFMSSPEVQQSLDRLGFSF